MGSRLPRSSPGEPASRVCSPIKPAPPSPWELSPKSLPQAARLSPCLLRSEPAPPACRAQVPSPTLSLLSPSCPRFGLCRAPAPARSSFPGSRGAGAPVLKGETHTRPAQRPGPGSLRWTPHPPSGVTVSQLVALSEISDLEVCPCLSSNPQHGPCPVPGRGRAGLCTALLLAWAWRRHAVGAQQLAWPKENHHSWRRAALRHDLGVTGWSCPHCDDATPLAVPLQAGHCHSLVASLLPPPPAPQRARRRGDPGEEEGTGLVRKAKVICPFPGQPEAWETLGMLTHMGTGLCP